jgi:hypothetical protein
MQPEDEEFGRLLRETIQRSPQERAEFDQTMADCRMKAVQMLSAYLSYSLAMDRDDVITGLAMAAKFHGMVSDLDQVQISGAITTLMDWIVMEMIHQNGGSLLTLAESMKAGKVPLSFINTSEAAAERALFESLESKG